MLDVCPGVYRSHPSSLGGHGPKYCDDPGNHCCLHSTSSPANLSDPLQFLLVLLSDVAAIGDGHICLHSLSILFFHSVRLIRHHLFVRLYLQVPQDVFMVSLHQGVSQKVQFLVDFPVWWLLVVHRRHLLALF